VNVIEAELEELFENPLSGSGALLGRELTRIGHRPDGNELRQLVTGLRHQCGNALSQFHVPLAARHSGGLELLYHLLESGQLIRAVDLDHQQLTLKILLSAMTGRIPGPPAPFVSWLNEALTQRAVAFLQIALRRRLHTCYLPCDGTARTPACWSARSAGSLCPVPLVCFTLR
jgi:hypothetical protein